MKEDSAETLFQSFLREAVVCSSGRAGMSTLWHRPSNISSADHGIAHPSRRPEEWFWGGCRGTQHAQTMQVSVSWQLQEGVLCAHEEVEFAPHQDSGLMLQVWDAEKFPQALGPENLDLVSSSIVKKKLDVDTLWMILSSWMAIAPCLTVKPHPNWCLVTNTSVYTTRSCGLLFYWISFFPSIISPPCLQAILNSVFPSNWYGLPAKCLLWPNQLMIFKAYLQWLFMVYRPSHCQGLPA